MRLYLVRHAESSNNALWVNTGGATGRSDDPVLSQKGVQQAEHLATFLASNTDPLEPGGLGLTHLYCSAMARAAHTASVLGAALHMPPVVWEDWHETGGIWLEGDDGVRTGQPGKTRAELQALFPGLVFPAGFASGVDGWWSRPYEADARPRAQRVWQEVLARHGNTDDHVAVVSHGHFLALVLVAAFGLPLEPKENGLFALWFNSNNTSVTRLDISNDGSCTLALVYQNRLAHLPLGLVSAG